MATKFFVSQFEHIRGLRALTTVTATRSAWRQISVDAPSFLHPYSLSRATVYKRYKPQACVTHFSSSTWRYKQHNGDTSTTNDNGEDVRTTKQKSPKRKLARAHSPNSLRRVAVDAQRSRGGFIKGTGKRRFVDPEADTKDITASCSAELYNISIAKRLLQKEGYQIDPLKTGLDDQVIHIQTPNYLAKDAVTGVEMAQGSGDVFVFPSGCVISWNVPDRVQKHLVHHVLVPAAENPHAVEIEDLEYLEDSARPNSEVIGDTIILGTQGRSLVEVEEDEVSTPEIDAVLAKIAFSLGLARSTKLAVLENLLSSYFETTRSIPITLSKGSKLRFTRSFILRKTGELLSIRAQLNLYSELTDAMPDIFWDSPSQLGLSDYYDDVGRALDVNVRIRALNEKMDYASEIASVLRERLSEKHSTGLEWLIIFLISIEVGFELKKIWRERQEEHDPDNTEALFRRWLLMQHGLQST